MLVGVAVAVVLVLVVEVDVIVVAVEVVVVVDEATKGINLAKPESLLIHPFARHALNVNPDGAACL